MKEFIYLQKNNKILLATSNKGKIKEFNNIFSDFHLIPQDDFGISEPIEDGLTFFENALIKARNAAKESGIFTIADDSGIVVPALDFEPGIYSARYAGMNASDLDNRNKIILGLKERNLTSSHAYYVCVLVGLNNEDDPMPIVTSGEIHGEVSIKSSGDGGFGYDSIFQVTETNCRAAELDKESKNKLSHRGKAIASLLQQLQSQ